MILPQIIRRVTLYLFSGRGDRKQLRLVICFYGSCWSNLAKRLVPEIGAINRIATSFDKLLCRGHVVYKRPHRFEIVLHCHVSLTAWLRTMVRAEGEVGIDVLEGGFSAGYGVRSFINNNVSPAEVCTPGAISRRLKSAAVTDLTPRIRLPRTSEGIQKDGNEEAQKRIIFFKRGIISNQNNTVNDKKSVGGLRDLTRKLPHLKLNSRAYIPRSGDESGQRYLMVMTQIILS
ncbi:hypothetical protein J6590_035843 [Homalodisca vitripennis]|nr:hypothetical protein J6590_035843 [Homalodisca vitripennis]